MTVFSLIRHSFSFISSASLRLGFHELLTNMTHVTLANDENFSEGTALSCWCRSLMRCSWELSFILSFLVTFFLTGHDKRQDDLDEKGSWEFMLSHRVSFRSQVSLFGQHNVVVLVNTIRLLSFSLFLIHFQKLLLFLFCCRKREKRWSSFIVMSVWLTWHSQMMMIMTSSPFWMLVFPLRSIPLICQKRLVYQQETLLRRKWYSSFLYLSRRGDFSSLDERMAVISLHVHLSSSWSLMTRALNFRENYLINPLITSSLRDRFSFHFASWQFVWGHPHNFPTS